MKNETLKTFIDVPEKIESVMILNSTENSVKISWSSPENNNSKITKYNVYLKKGEDY
jgi:hypothetical protein